MNHLICFASENMTISRDKCIQSALKHGMDTFTRCSSDDISDEFFIFNKDILEQPRGAGYWLWKPYFIYQALCSLPEGSYVHYSDAGIEFVGNVQQVIDAMDNDLMLFSNGWQDVHWSKMDIIRGINGMTFQVTQTQSGNFYNMGDYEDYRQVQASNLIFKNTEFSRDFVKEWLLLCQIPGWIDDSVSIIPNHPEFQDNRHDQSILTALCYKYGIKQHWFPSTTNLHKRQDFSDRYDPIFLHHRKRNEEW
jgi:hypothetical protein